MNHDAQMYSQHHNMQTRDANNLFDRVLPEISFEDDDVVMDVGCGTGETTKNLLLPRIPRLKKLIAVDAIPKMIEFARTHAAHEKIEYHVADIEDESSIKDWEGSVSKIFSIHCFNWLNSQRKGFESLYSLLKPKGQAVVLYAISSKPWNCYPELVNHPKWNKYLKDVNQCVPESHHLNYRAGHFRKILEDVGYEVLLCEDEDTTFTYKDDNECKAAFTSRSALTSYIPAELKEEFTEDLFKGFLKHNPRNADGLPTSYITVLTVRIKKP